MIVDTVCHRQAPLHERHRVASNLYKTYITRFGSAVRDEIDDATVLRMKSFLVGEQVGTVVRETWSTREYWIPPGLLPCHLNRLNQMLFSMLKPLFIVFCNLIIMPHFWSRNNTMLCVELSIQLICKIVCISSWAASSHLIVFSFSGLEGAIVRLVNSDLRWWTRWRYWRASDIPKYWGIEWRAFSKRTETTDWPTLSTGEQEICLDRSQRSVNFRCNRRFFADSFRIVKVTSRFRC